MMARKRFVVRVLEVDDLSPLLLGLPSERLMVTGMPSRMRAYFSSLICIREAVDRREAIFFCASSTWAEVSHGFRCCSACRKYRVSRISL